MNIIENKTNMPIEDVIAITNREGNKKRSYLILNKLQAKYIPVNPKVTLDMFELLAKEISCSGKVVVVGFAETATAIGARVAFALKDKADSVTYINTTREQRNANVMAEFKEEHSHAVEQILYGNREVFESADYVIFAEDEITTGNTICNCVKELNLGCKYIAASLLNCMNDKEIERFRENNIEACWLIKTDKEGLESQYEVKEETIVASNFDDPRLGINIEEYTKTASDLGCMLSRYVSKSDKVLVLGTEECMYPAIIAAEAMNLNGIDAVVNATTRVPTCIEGPLSNRRKIKSFYGERDTYIYNLDHYDTVFVITDGNADSNLNTELRSVGVRNIYTVRIGG